jgi:hypothetical protein
MLSNRIAARRIASNTVVPEGTETCRFTGENETVTESGMVDTGKKSRKKTGSRDYHMGEPV